MMVGRLLSFWDGLFSGAMLNFQGVILFIHQEWISNFATHNPNAEKSHHCNGFKPQKCHVLPLPQETLRARHCSKSMVLWDPRMSCVDQKCPHRWRLPQCLALAAGRHHPQRTAISSHHVCKELEFMGHVDTCILYIYIYNVGKDGLVNTP